MVQNGRAPYALFFLIALVMAFRFGGRGTVLTFFNVYLDQGLDAPTALIGTLLAAGQLISVPAALLAPLLTARWGNPRIIWWGMLAWALCTLPLALVPTWGAAGISYVTSAIFFSVTVGPVRVFSQSLVAPRWRATMASAFMMGAALAFAVVAFIGGYAIVTLGYQALFLVAASLSAASGFVYWFWFRVPRGEQDRQSRPRIGD
jgi:predicted MFS family arabinose efflux permease